MPDTAHKKCAIKGTKLGAEGTVTAKSELHKQALGVESEIHPSHKTSFYALCISPLQGANLRKRKL